jgi:hypothetical protein
VQALPKGQDMVDASKSSRPMKRRKEGNTQRNDNGTAVTSMNDGQTSLTIALPDSIPLRAFLASISLLTQVDRSVIVEQAILLLENLYAHLPLKCAMHAVDPLQRLRLLRRRISQYDNDLIFHAEMTDIFTSLRDLHTNYILPTPFRNVIAALPFRVEQCYNSEVCSYIVAGVAEGFSHATFVPGVEITYWSGIPIFRAVEISASQHAGSNAAARTARGIAGLTVRPMIISPPPDEGWVIVGYRAMDGTELELRFNWTVTGLPIQTVIAPAETVNRFATALGLDLETDAVQQINKMLYAPQVALARQELAAFAKSS